MATGWGEIDALEAVPVVADDPVEIDAEDGDDLLDLDIDGAFLGLSLHM